MIRITLRDRSFQAKGLAGRTLLESALVGEVPLRYACRHADCGTCLVGVDDPEGALDGPSEAERACLARIGAGPNDRLACQARLRRDPEHLGIRLLTEDPDA